MNVIKAKPLIDTKSFISFTGVLVALFFAVYQLYSNGKKPALSITQQKKAINLESNFLKITSVGHRRLISSFLWIETLLNSDLNHYEEGDLKDWMYLRFNTITDLDPYFYEAYLYGGIYLSIIKDDERAASKIYSKGMIAFPNDFYLLLNASFHYYYELNDIDKSLELLSKIYDHPKAPSYLPSLYARLKSTKGDLKSALALVYSFYQNAPEDSAVKNSYAHKAYAIKAEIDLNCLNKNLDNCEKVDFFGKPYLKEDGKFYAQEEWKPFKIKKRPQAD